MFATVISSVGYGALNMAEFVCHWDQQVEVAEKRPGGFVTDVGQGSR